MLVFLYGKTGAGKDYLARNISRIKNIEQLKRPTTRPMRGEFERRYYDFLAEVDFLSLLEKKEIFAHFNFRGWHYGIYSRDIHLDGVKVITGDKQTAFAARDLLGDNIVLVEVLADEGKRLSRAEIREDNPDRAEILRRMKSDDYEYEKLIRIPDLYFDNNDGEYLEEEIDSLIEKVENIMEEKQK